jgi:Na+-driven multidrug efflux pump
MRALRRPAWNASINPAVLVVALSVALVTMFRLGVHGAGLGLLCGELLGTVARWAVFLQLAQGAARGGR